MLFVSLTPFLFIFNNIILKYETFCVTFLRVIRILFFFNKENIETTKYVIFS